MDYLHWIGKAFYTQNSYIKEATEHGATRRIALNIVKQMNWGDTVFCAMKDGKTGVIFGKFEVELLSGLSPDAFSQIEETHPTDFVNKGNNHIEKGCGEFTIEQTSSVNDEMSSVVDTIEELKDNDEEIGFPLVGGTFFECNKIRLLDIPFRQGFRTIDANALLEEAKANKNRVHGQFYIDNKVPQDLKMEQVQQKGLIQQVVNYRKGKRR